MYAKLFPLRSHAAIGFADGARDFASDEAQGEDASGVSPRELYVKSLLIGEISNMFMNPSTPKNVPNKFTIA